VGGGQRNQAPEQPRQGEQQGDEERPQPVKRARASGGGKAVKGGGAAAGLVASKLRASLMEYNEELGLPAATAQGLVGEEPT
jgi:hypothetical protein